MEEHYLRILEMLRRVAMLASLNSMPNEKGESLFNPSCTLILIIDSSFNSF